MIFIGWPTIDVGFSIQIPSVLPSLENKHLVFCQDELGSHLLFGMGRGRIWMSVAHNQLLKYSFTSLPVLATPHAPSGGAIS